MAGLRKSFIDTFVEYQECGGLFYTTMAEFDAAKSAGLVRSASQDIVKLTINRANMIDNLPEVLQNAIKEATTIQLDYRANIGVDEFAVSRTENDAEVSIGKFKYGGGRTNPNDDSRRLNRYSPEAKDFLRQYGLTSRAAQQQPDASVFYSFPHNITDDGIDNG